MSIEEENKPKKRGRPASNKQYFGPDEEDAVRKYLSFGGLIDDPLSMDKVKWTGTTTDIENRKVIYETHLKKPLDKMIESIIRRYKLYSKHMTFEDLHTDTLSFLMVKFHKFKASKGKKSYSYYGTICKNYLLGKIQKEQQKMKNSISYEDISSLLEEREDMTYRIDDYDVDLSEMISTISESIKSELSNKNLTDNEIKIGNSLVTILDNWEQIFQSQIGSNKYNKNIILYSMRELTSLTTKDIRTGMKRYKVIYKLLKNGDL